MSANDSMFGSSSLNTGYGSPQFASLARNQNALRSAYRTGVRQARRLANRGGPGAADAAMKAVTLLERAQSQGINATGMSSYEEDVAALNQKYADMSRQSAVDEDLKQRAYNGVSKIGRMGTPGAAVEAPEQTGEDKGTKINLGASAKEEAKTAMKKGASTGTTPAPGSYEARAAALTEQSRNERLNTADTGDGGMQAAIALRQKQVDADKANGFMIKRPPVQGSPEAISMARLGYGSNTSDTAQDQTTSAAAALSSNGGDGNMRSGATPEIAKAADNKQENPIKDAVNKEAPGRRAPRLGATPEGMELVGMKSGVPQYLPINEVYGDLAKGVEQAGPMQEKGAMGQGVKPLTDEQVRNEYQTKYSTPESQAGAQKMMEDTNVLPQSQPKPTASPIPRGPASQPARTAQEGWKGRSQRETWDMENANAKALKDREANTVTMDDLKRAYGDNIPDTAMMGINADGSAQTKDAVNKLAEARDKKTKRPGNALKPRR